MTVAPVRCPLCENTPLVPHPGARFECAKTHGFFTLLDNFNAARDSAEPLLKHGTTGLEFALGRFTSAEWDLFRREAGLPEA